MLLASEGESAFASPDNCLVPEDVRERSERVVDAVPRVQYPVPLRVASRFSGASGALVAPRLCQFGGLGPLQHGLQLLIKGLSLSQVASTGSPRSPPPLLAPPLLPAVPPPRPFPATANSRCFLAHKSACPDMSFRGPPRNLARPLGGPRGDSIGYYFAMSRNCREQDNRGATAPGCSDSPGAIRP